MKPGKRLSPSSGENTVIVRRSGSRYRPYWYRRPRFLAPLALAQFICSFAGSNMNVMINDISEDLNTDVKGVQWRSPVSF
jgi:hypothetical protein